MISDTQDNTALQPTLHKANVSTRLSIGARVETPHGRGQIVDEEVFRTCERWGVKLDKNPFPFPVAFYFKNEIRRVIEVSSSS